MKPLPALTPALFALLAVAARADVVFPVSPAERDATIMDSWTDVPVIVLAQCESTADAETPARVKILATNKGSVKAGESLRIPLLKTSRNLKGGGVPAEVALQKDATYVLFLESAGKGYVLSQRSLVRMWSYAHSDGTELLENGGARVVGKPEDSRVWQVLELMRKAESGGAADRARVVRLRVRELWQRHAVCTPEILKEIEGLAGGEEPEHRILVTRLLRDDLPLLGFRDAGLDALAERCGIKAGDPWRWDAAPRPETFDLHAYTTAAKGGVEAERAAARAAIAEICRNGGSYARGHIRSLPESRIFVDELRAAFRDASAPALDWSRLCGLAATFGPLGPSLEERDVAALVTIVTSPEFSGARGENSMWFAREFERLSGFAVISRATQFYDPALLSAPVAAWWEKEGAKQGRFHPAAK